ncbi:MAG TPA: ABC transporter ATP-binding protein [Bellilinea sp.]|nr:ABC transporter ATP-binding protein [Bellilinea sp.]
MVATQSPLISLRGVKKTYATGGVEVQALKGIDLEVHAGEFLGILGKSGAGKTTLVNMIAGLDHLSEGQVIVNDVNVQSLNESDLALWRGKNIGVIFQSFQLLPTLNLLDNIMLPMDFCGLYQRRASYERAMYLLDQVELKDHALKLPSAISGGQQQRVAIARALVNDPPILLADEPTGRLDTTTAETIFNLFENLIGQGKTIIMVTHDHSLADRTTRALTIADGLIAGQEIHARVTA